MTLSVHEFPATPDLPKLPNILKEFLSGQTNLPDLVDTRDDTLRRVLIASLHATQKALEDSDAGKEAANKAPYPENPRGSQSDRWFGNFDEWGCLQKGLGVHQTASQISRGIFTHVGLGPGSFTGRREQAIPDSLTLERGQNIQMSETGNRTHRMGRFSVVSPIRRDAHLKASGLIEITESDAVSSTSLGGEDGNLFMKEGGKSNRSHSPIVVPIFGTHFVPGEERAFLGVLNKAHTSGGYISRQQLIRGCFIPFGSGAVEAF